MVAGCESRRGFDERFLGDDAGSAQEFCSFVEDERVRDAVLGLQVAGDGFLEVTQPLV